MSSYSTKADNTPVIIGAVVVAGIMLLALVGWVVAGPDREACRVAVNTELSTVLNTPGPVQGSSLQDEAAVRARLAWPCRWQSDAQMDDITQQVLNERMPEIFLKGLGDVFGG